MCHAHPQPHPRYWEKTGLTPADFPANAWQDSGRKLVETGDWWINPATGPAEEFTQEAARFVADLFGVEATASIGRPREGTVD